MFRGFGFVQFERIEEAEAAKAAQKGRIYKGYKIGKVQPEYWCPSIIKLKLKFIFKKN